MRHSARNRFIEVTFVFFLATALASLTGCSTIRGPEEATLPPISSEPVAITAIGLSEEEGYSRVTIEGSGELVYESLELRENPLRISVAIPNASVEVTSPIPVYNAMVTEILATEENGDGRVEIGLTDRAPYNITQEASSLYIDIESGMRTATTEVDVTAPLEEEELEISPPMQAAKALTGVSVTKQESVTEVTVTADGAIGDYNAFTMKAPPRLVLDLWELKSTFPKNTVYAGTPHLKQVRIGKHPKKIRLVLDTSGSTVPKYQIDRVQNELLINLGVADGLETGVQGVLASVDFKQIANKSRVILSNSKRVDYEIFKVSQKDVVIDLKNTRTPEHLKRILDTRAFDSAVESIHMYNVRSERSSDVRVIIRLREMVDFEAFQENERIFVDFQRPQRLQKSDRPASEPEGMARTIQPEEKGKVVSEEEKAEEQPAFSIGVEEEMNAEIAMPESIEAEESLDTGVAEAKNEIGKKPVSAAIAPAKSSAAEEESFYEFALTPGKTYTGRRLSLDFKDAEIKNILRLIAEVSNLNIVAGEDVKGKVTIRLIDVPWDQALDIILFSNNLGKMRMGNVIRVAPVEVLKREQEELLSARRTKEKLEDLVTELIPVNYSTAQELQVQVQNILSERGSISIDARTNTLVIKDIPSVVSEARQLVESLDTKTPQVIIEARIVEASTNFSRDLGIKWGGTLANTQIGGESGTIGVTGSVSGATPADTVANLPVEAATTAITFNLAGLGDIANLDIELSALEDAGEGEIISAPRITTLDNKEASIEQGLRIPYLKLTAEGTATTEFIEANIKLSVIPHVTNDGHIKMNIKASKDAPDDTITVQGVPAIDKKEAITEVLVENGDIVVIAGIYTIEKTDNVSRVPLLGRVPILGWLFKKTEIEDDRRDLLIFISPKIVQETA